MLSPTVPIPRMRAVVETSLDVEVTTSPDVSNVRSLMSRTPESRSSCEPIEVTVIGTSCRSWSRFCAVTMTVVSRPIFVIRDLLRRLREYAAA